MKRLSVKSALLGAAGLAAVSLAGAGVARADLFSPVWTVSAWTTTTGTIGGTNFINAAQTPAPTAAATATFTYTGQLNFDNPNPQGGSNTFSDFFGGGSNISGLSSSALTALLNTTMSAPGSSNYTYLEFSLNGPLGTIQNGATIALTHDDGASVYQNGLAIIQSPGETAVGPNQPQVAALLPGTLNSFTVDYVEANGSPAVLKVAVPDPGSLALLGTGLLGIGLVMRRRRRRTA